MKFNYLTIILCLFFIRSKLFSQGISGSVTDSNNKPIPFTSVFVENLKSGTVSSEDGVFSYKIPAGNYTVVFRALGYLPDKQEVVIYENQMATIKVQLKEQIYQLSEVQVNPGKEDPAYPIMRKAISMAPYYLNYVKHYKSEVYLKSSLRITDMPRLFNNHVMINNHSIKNGDVFLQESQSEFTFDAPNHYTQRVISQKTSFKIDSKNDVMSFISASLYQPTISEIISPLAPNAFTHYKFKYYGYFTEENAIVFKIKVLPRRKSPQLFSGDIMIFEHTWNIHSVDLLAVPVFGDIKIKQVYAPVAENVWLPVTYDIKMDAEMFGCTAKGEYLAIDKFSDIQMNKSLKLPKIIAEEYNRKLEILDSTKMAKQKNILKDKELKKMAELAQKEKLTNREMLKMAKLMKKQSETDVQEDTTLEINDKRDLIIDADAEKKDSIYWANLRPIPLRTDELITYHVSDSVMIEEAKPVPDSIKNKKNNNILNPIIFGKYFYSADSSLSMGYSGIACKNFFSFNTVDGFNFKQYLVFTKKINSTRFIEIKPNIIYSFNREKIFYEINSKIFYAPLKNGLITLNAGNEDVDYNQESGISPLINSVASLFFRRNYMKLINKQFLNSNNSIEITNGLKFDISAEYSQLNKLDNISDYSFFYRKEREYTTNTPINQNITNSTYLNNSNLFLITAKIEYTPKQYYRIKNGLKINEFSKYPTFSMLYKKAINNVINSNIKYDYLECGIKQDIKIGNNSHFKYSINSGIFLNKEDIHFQQFKHFNSQESPVFGGDINSAFMFTKAYELSTSDYFIEAHFNYLSAYILLKYLPIISRYNMQENIYFNYLFTPDNKNYFETGYGCKMPVVGTVGVFASFENGKYSQTGIKICLPF